MMKKALSLLFILHCMWSLHAATYYISTDGFDYWPGNELKPWKTISYGVRQLSAGDTLIIKDGEYFEEQIVVSATGTAENPIVIKAENQFGARVISNSRWHILGTSNTAKHVIFDGLDISHRAEVYPEVGPVKNYNNGKFFGIAVGSNAKGKAEHITIKNMYVHQCAFSGTGMNADHLTVHNNVFADNAHDDDGTNQNGSGLTFAGARHLGDDGAPGYHIYITNNVIFNNWADENVGSQGGATDGNGIIMDYANGGSFTEWKARTLIANNVVFNNGGNGISVFQSDSVDIVNNTSVYNGWLISDPVLGNKAFNARQIGSASSDGLNFYNNIAIDLDDSDKTQSLWSEKSQFETKGNIVIGKHRIPGIYQDYNDIRSLSAGIDYLNFRHDGMSNGEIYASLINLRLNDNSPAVDFQYTVNSKAFGTDADGLNRIVNGQVDAGAYELGNDPVTRSVSLENATGNGSLSPSSGTSYPEGSYAIIEAFPDDGYELDYWSGDVPEGYRSSPAILVMDTDKSITAHFREVLIQPANNLAAGKIATVSSTYSLGDHASDNLTDGDLTTSWKNNFSDMPNEEPVITLDLGNQYNVELIKMLFEGQGWPNQMYVTFSRDGASFPDTIDLFRYTGLAPLFRSNTNSTYHQTEGDTLYINMKRDFRYVKFLLSEKIKAGYGIHEIEVFGKLACDNPVQIIMTNKGNGNASPSTGSICPGEVIFTATPHDEAHHFDGWSGDITGNENPKTVNVTTDLNVTALFSINKYSLTVDVDNNSHGSVKISPDQPFYEHGSLVSLIAVSSEGYSFDSWTELQEEDDTVNITMLSDTLITANFKLETYISPSNYKRGSTVKLFPSPVKANSEFVIEIQGLDNESLVDLNIYDLTGKHVYSTSFITGGGNRKAITNKIMKDKGMYFLTVTAKSKTITTKIIVVD